MIIAVRAMHVMEMARDEVVDVIAVRNGLVATARSVMVFAVMPVAAVIGVQSSGFCLLTLTRCSSK